MRPELAPGSRLAGLSGAFLLLYLASPGILSRGGSAALAVLAMALWASFASRPGRRAWRLDFLVGGLAWAGICSWSAHVWGPNPAILGAGFGVYMGLAGALLRRTAARFPLALAAPAAWLLAETIRALLPPPFGMPWMRLGTHLHDLPWIAGSARVWGVAGLTWVLAAGGGLLASAIEALLGARGRPGKSELVQGLVPLAAALALARLVPAPAMVEGPRVLLVQPGFPQERKMHPRHPRDLFVEQTALTARGLEEAARRGEPPPDLVAWAETMLPTTLVAPDLVPAMRAGAESFPWRELEEWHADALAAQVRQMVDETLLGASGGAPAGVLPPGTAFLSGAEYWRPADGFIRRQNAVFLWERPGPPAGPVSKRHLVPGGESMLGLERYEGVRAAIFRIAAYVPDFLGDRGDGRVLAFTARDGRRYGMGASVCFDNAFDDVFTEPLREAARGEGPPVDFHIVVSNEAWFRASQEADQMVAFSRLAAMATGRAVVRATNSGVSAAFAPDGRELARLEVGGRDREVQGTLLVRVPVPPPESARAATPFVRLEPALDGLGIGIGALLLGLSRWWRRPPRRGDGLPSHERGYKDPAPPRAARRARGGPASGRP